MTYYVLSGMLNPTHYVCVLKSDVQSQAVTVDKSLSVEQCHIHASGVLSFTSEIKVKVMNNDCYILANGATLSILL